MRILVSSLMVLGLVAPLRADEAADELFEARIRPVLVKVCLPCHGGRKTESGLRVDSRQGLVAGGDRGAAVVPGNAAKSLLIEAMRGVKDDLVMPPKKRLSSVEIADFERWVDRGAVWPSAAIAGSKKVDVAHWAFQRVRAVSPPALTSRWGRNPVDAFIAARLESAGLRPVKPADRLTLLRRVTLDLIGLPPTPAEIAAFRADRSPAAFERVVDRLLASPHYGERWGRHWMDVARYADTAGDNADYPVPEAALYRDWIIAAFNADMPYDQFVREQLAGDILARRGLARDPDQAIVATGFLALSRRYATGPYELWHLTLEDAIDATGQAFLGLTMRCARCHDHKFDPIRQRDYYALYGAFSSTDFPYAGSEEFHSQKRPRSHFAALGDPAASARAIAEYERRLAELAGQIKVLAGKGDAASRKRSQELSRERLALERPGLPPGVASSYAVSEGKGADVAIQRRGEPGQPGSVVPRGVPAFAFLASRPEPRAAGDESGRLSVARWIADKDNPLTARVMVNRIWQHHFGNGLVATPSNFGRRGAAPSHPELLDCLADRLVASGWSVKAVQRLIVLSSAYALASDFDPANAAVDPENRLLWRHSRARLDAESIRDALLAASGRLDSTMKGRQPFPPIQDWEWTQHNPFKAVYATNRRTVYVMTQRLVKHPFLAVFDGPDANVTTAERGGSTVPLQALYFMNNPFVRAQASGLAARVEASSRDVDDRIELAVELAWGRRPSPDETRRMRGFLAACAQATSGHDREPWKSLAAVLLSSSEFLYVE